MGLDDIAIFGICLVSYHIYANGPKTIDLIVTLQALWVGTWIAKRNKKRENAEQSQAALLDSSCGLEALSLGFTLRRWAVPFVVGLYRSSLGCTVFGLCPFVFGFYPPSLGLNPPSLGFTLRRRVCPSLLGSTLRRWAMPFAVGISPPSLGYALRRWVLPSVAGVCPPLLGVALRRWALPSAVGLYLSSLGVFVVAFAMPAWSSSSCRRSSCRSSSVVSLSFVVVRVCRLPSSASVVRCPRRLSSRGGG
jgi:hypothetical protein